MPHLIFGDVGPATVLAIVAAVYAGSITQSTLGIGFGLVAAPILIIASPDAVPGVVILLGGSTAWLSAFRGRRDIRVQELALATCGRIAGTVAAAALLSAVPSREFFALVFAGALLLAVGMSLLGPPIPFTMRNVVFAGGLSGLLGTVTSVGGPPMGLVYQGQPASPARATLNAFFAIGVLPSYVALAVTGYLTTAHLIQAALLFPVVLAGVATARKLIPYADQRYRKLVLGFCGIAAIIVAARAIAQLA